MHISQRPLSLIRQTHSAFQKQITLPPEIIMYNKNKHMVAYGIISWHHEPTSPFFKLNIPSITKLNLSEGYLSNKEITHLIHSLERRMMKFGHLTFGATLTTDPEDSKRIPLLFNMGYESQILTDNPKTIYLMKQLKLLS